MTAEIAAPSNLVTLTPAAPEANALEHALALGRSGFRVVFVHAPTGNGCTCGVAHEDGKAIGKHPVSKAWQRNASADEQAIRDARASLKFEPNVGIVLGEQPGGAYLVAIDVDDEERFFALVEQYGELPDTLTSHSARGYRFIYRIAQDIPVDRVKNITGLGGSPGVDVKARAGQIVVAPSIHASGARYRWGETLTVAELPNDWTHAILAPPVRPQWVAEYTPHTMREDVRASNRARKYLEKATITEASLVARSREGTRNSALHLALCRLLPLAHGCHLMDGHAYVVRELSNAARGAGLPSREITSTVASAERWLRESGAVRVLPHEPSPAAPMRSAALAESVDAPEAPEASEAPEQARPPALELIQDKGSIAPLASNVAEMLPRYSRGAPRYDEFADRITWPDGSALKETDALLVQKWLYQQPESERVRASVETITHGLLLAAHENRYHPVRLYLDALSWDGTSRVARLFPDYFGAPDAPFECAASVCFLVGAVARIQKPGAKVDTLPVLEGRQGIGKSTALNILGGVWFSDSVIPQKEPDCYQVLRGAWIYELSELASMRGREVERTKAFITSRTDRYRTSYGRMVQDVPRETVFAGTTNAAQYLADDTGGRRFHPIHCEHIDTEGLARDRDQLWAEAVHLYREGKPWHLSGELASAQSAVAELRRHEDPWGAIVQAITHGTLEQLPPATQERVSALVPPSTPIASTPPLWTAHEWLLAIGIDAGRQTKGDEMRLSALLTKSGWKRRRISDGTGRKYVYALEVGTGVDRCGQ